MTFPTVVGSSGGVVGGFAHALAIPAGWPGDLLLIVICEGNNLPEPYTWSPGWTVLGSALIAPGGGEGRIEAAYRIADGSEGPTVNVQTPIATNVAYHSDRIRNYVALPAAGVTWGNNAAPDPPSLTSGFGAVDTLWLAVAGWTNPFAPLTGYPATYTDGTYDKVPDGSGVATARRALHAATEDPGPFALGAGGGWNIMFTIAIKGGAPASTPAAFPRHW